MWGLNSYALLLLTSDIDLWYWSLILISDIDLWYWPLILTSDIDLWYWPLILTYDIDLWYWPMILISDIDLWYWPLILISDIDLWYWTVTYLYECMHACACGTQEVQDACVSVWAAVCICTMSLLLVMFTVRVWVFNVARRRCKMLVCLFGQQCAFAQSHYYWSCSLFVFVLVPKCKRVGCENSYYMASTCQPSNLSCQLVRSTNCILHRYPEYGLQLPLLSCVLFCDMFAPLYLYNPLYQSVCSIYH